MTKSFEERITETNERITQLENQKKQLIQKQKAEERKARTKRLIERGAILESLIDGAENLTNEQVKIFLEKTVANDFGRRMLATIAAQGGEATPAEPTATAQGNTHAASQIGSNGARQES